MIKLSVTMCVLLLSAWTASADQNQPVVRPDGLVCRIDLTTAEGFLSSVQTAPGKTNLNCSEARLIANVLNEEHNNGANPVLAEVIPVPTTN